MRDIKSWWSTLKQTVEEFFAHDALRLSSSLSYYAVFSLAPLLLICIAIAGFVFGEDAVRGQLEDQLRSSLGDSGALAVQDLVANARKPEANIMASIAGVVMLIFGAGGLFGQLQSALNTVWGVEPKPGRGIRGIIKDRFLSFSMVLGTGFLLLTSMVLTTVLQAINDYTGRIANLPSQLWSAMGELASFGVITLLFAAIFKILPDTKVRWNDVWAGAVFTAFLFVVGKAVMGWYLGREATASSYGPAGSLALVLLWVYYSAIILLFGAEFTQVRAKACSLDAKSC